ncbi:MAG: hypothetical protein ACK5RO_01380 [Pseudobdellovibrionaceae bacterium]
MRHDPQVLYHHHSTPTSITRKQLMTTYVHKVTVTLAFTDEPAESKSFYLPLSRSKLMDHLKNNLPLTNQELMELHRNDEVLIQDESGNSIKYEIKDVSPDKESDDDAG